MQPNNMNSTLNNSAKSSKKNAAILSLLIGILLLIIKFTAFSLTRSQAIFSDAVESIVNVLGASAALWAIHSAEQPADKSHPYGHGKIEHFSSAFEGGLIGIASFFLIYESIGVLLKPAAIQRLGTGLVLVSLAGLVNLILGLFLLQKGKRIDSPALQSSGHHLLSDFWTSLGVLSGLFLVLWTGWLWLDGLIGLLVGLLLGWTSIKIVRGSMDRLADRSDKDLLDALGEALDANSGTGIIQIHHVKILKVGSFHHIDAHVIIPGHWTILEGHDYTRDYEKQVLTGLKREGEIAFHMDPCRKSYCANCLLDGCPHRVAEFEAQFSFKTVELTNHHPDLEAV